MLSEDYMTLVLANRLYERSNGAISDFSVGSPIRSLLSILAFSIAEIEYAVGTIPDSLLIKLSELWGEKLETGATKSKAVFEIVPIDTTITNVIPAKVKIFGNGLIFELSEELTILPGQVGQGLGICTTAGMSGNVEPYAIRSVERAYSGLVERAYNISWGVGGQDDRTVSDWLNSVIGSSLVTLADIEKYAHSMINRVPVMNRTDTAISDITKHPLAKVKIYQNYAPDYSKSYGFLLLLIAWTNSTTSYVTSALTDIIQNELQPIIPAGNIIYVRSAESIGVKIVFNIKHDSKLNRTDATKLIKEKILSAWQKINIGEVPNPRIGEQIEYQVSNELLVNIDMQPEFYFRLYPVAPITEYVPWEYWDLNHGSSVEFYRYCSLDSVICNYTSVDNFFANETHVAYQVLALIDSGENVE